MSNSMKFTEHEVLKELKAILKTDVEGLKTKSVDPLAAQGKAFMANAAPAAAVPGSVFQDSEGFISFVNLSSSLLASDELETGKEIADKICNFYSTLRPKMFQYLKNHPEKIPSGESSPENQWNMTVTNYMTSLLSLAFSGYERKEVSFSKHQTVVEFSSDVIKILFDIITVPRNILTSAKDFIKGLGDTLHFERTVLERNFVINLLAQCHEAVPLSENGQICYIPMIKLYYLSIDANEKKFTTPCPRRDKSSFIFNYSCNTYKLSEQVLKKNTDTFNKVNEILMQAQDVSYKDAKNTLTSILDETKSIPLTQQIADEIKEYPKFEQKAK